MTFQVPHYSALLEPIATITLIGHGGREIRLPVVLDTGFNRGLLLSEADARAANLPETQLREPMSVAGGATIYARVTSAFIRWFDDLKQVDVLVLPDHLMAPGGGRGRETKRLAGIQVLKGTTIRLRHDELVVSRV